MRRGTSDQRLGGKDREGNATPCGCGRGVSRALDDGSVRVRAAAAASATRRAAGQDTPYILVTTFQSADRKLGVEAGDEMRTPHPGRALGQGTLRRAEEQHQRHARGVGLSPRFGAECVGSHGALEAAPRRVRHRRQGDQGVGERGSRRDAHAAQDRARARWRSRFRPPTARMRAMRRRWSRGRSPRC